ncbi:DNA-directed RNA polymerase subunit F [Candidatus Micrarchaeota archaeon CG08_land_8_20_14_0_20_59_11]|nr:MAG: DNA-directed RNA polymerase subunit F [Candidatus Micrarchaeota archaeon CG08_land_8_20_14_0_20_59_11]
MKLVSEKPLAYSEALAVLEKRQKDCALSYEQQNTFDYLTAFAKITDKEAAELKKELVGMGVDERSAVVIASVLPKKEEEVKTILGKAGDTELPKNILKTVKKFTGKK